MTTREKVLVGVAVLFAALFVRLGFWQIERLRERQAFNEPIAARAGLAPVERDELPRDLEAARHRRVRLTGKYDFAHEIVLTLRSRDGSPGVHLLTPLRIAGSDTAILVNRGWIYAADGTSADTKPWHEPDPVSAVGYVRLLEADDTTSARTTARSDGVRRPQLATISSMLPYPVAPYYVVLSSPGSDPERTPPRVPPPTLDEGSHRSYAVQWFTFALIAVGGVAILILRLRLPDRERELHRSP